MGLLEAVLLCALGVGSITFISVGVKIFKSDSNEYNRFKETTGNWRNPIRGTVSNCHDGKGKDHLVSAGLAFNRKTNKWVAQGRLSDEAIDAILT